MAIPEQLANRYTIKEKIGQGAMGLVYLGADALTNQPVAIKSLITASNEEQFVRFRREGEALARLNHPNIVKMIDMVEHQGDQYLVMEYVTGGDLQQLMQAESQLSVERVMDIALELADALTRAHHLNIIHRDIKPANVLIAHDGTPRLSDFGIALFDEALGSGASISGTYAYLSPEAISSQMVDERTDIWAFGVMLYEMLTGKRPFSGDNMTQLIIGILNEPVPDIHAIRPDISNDLSDLIWRMLAKDPDKRIPSVRLVGAELEAMRKGVAVQSLFAPTMPVAVIPSPPPQSETTTITIPAPFQAPKLPQYFVGRQDVISQIETELMTGNMPMVALVGMGGSGKSTIAVEVAHQLKSKFADGVLWVDATISDPMDVLANWGDAYGFDFNGLPDIESRALAVRSMLAERQTLIVLDDVGQISRIRPLLPEAARCAILITTRDQEIAYGLDVEPILLNELAPEDSLRLLKQILGDRRVNAEREAAQTICDLLQNLPLAVEIAAQRLKSHRRRRLSDMAERLKDTQHRLGLAVSDQAVRTSFTLSWQALDMQQQRLFSLLGVFAGRPFMAEAVAHVADLDLYTTEDLLFALTALSLVREEGYATYRQHPLLADFSLEKLTAPDDAYRLLTGYYYTFTQEFAADYEKLHPEWDNITAVIEVAYQQEMWSRVLGFAEILTPAWKARGRYTQARQAYKLAHEATQHLSDNNQLAANLLRWGEACLEQNDNQEAKQLLTEALMHFGEMEDGALIASTKYQLARIAIVSNQFSEGWDLLQDSQSIRQTLGDQTGIGQIKRQQARISYLGDQLERADLLAQEALSLQEMSEEHEELIETLRLLVQIATKKEDLSQAQHYAEQAQKINEQLQDQGQMAMILYSLTFIHYLRGNFSEALENGERGLEAVRRMGFRRVEAFILHEMSLVHKELKSFQVALQLEQKGLQILRDMDDHLSAAYSLLNLGDLYVKLGRPEEAKTAWNSALETAVTLNHSHLERTVQGKLKAQNIF